MSGTTTDPVPSPASVDQRLAYFTTYGAIAMVVLIVNVFTDPARYADLDAYVYYLDTLVHFPPDSWLYFEVFSNIFLLTSYWLTLSVFSGVILAHYLIGIIFVLAMPAAFPLRRSPWPALLFMFAILGPLLAFVTMRATPAYFLVAVAVRHAMERRWTAWILLAAATLFHISSLLAFVPMALLYFEHMLPDFMRRNHSSRYYLFGTIIIMAFGAILPQVSSSVAGAIQSIPVISKYEVYANVSENQTQIGHYIFLLFAFGLTLAFMISARNEAHRLKIYIISSFLLYVVMFFSASPIAAFRQAAFWIIPMIAMLPWERVGINKITTPLFVVACAGLFVFQFQQVYM